MRSYDQLVLQGVLHAEGQLFYVSAAELLNPADVCNSASANVLAVEESAAPADSPLAHAIIVAAVQEATAAADILDFVSIGSDSVLESGNASDSMFVGERFAAAIQESASPADKQSAKAKKVGRTTEKLNASAACASAFTHQKYSGSIAESAAAAAMPSTTVKYLVAVDHQRIADDQPSAIQIYHTSAEETINVDTHAVGTAAFACAYHEQGAAAADVTATLREPVARAEIADAQDEQNSTVGRRGIFAESLNAADAIVVEAIFKRVTWEGLVIADEVISPVSENASVAEIPSASDEFDGSFIMHDGIVETIALSDRPDAAPNVPPFSGNTCLTGADAMLHPFEVGNEIVLVANFYDLNNALADPLQITAEVRKPDGTSVDISTSVTRLGVGYYAAAFTPDQAGLYIYRFVGDGAIAAASEQYFSAQSSFE